MDKTLSDKIFKNKMIMEGTGYFFLDVEAVKEAIKKLKEELDVTYFFKDKQLRDHIINSINKVFGGELTK